MRRYDKELNDILVDTYHHVLQVEETQKKYTRTKLSFRDRNALELIEESENGCRISDIAEYLKISRPSATSVIKKLEGLGLVEKVSDERDERTTLARITKRGGLMCAYQRQYRNRMTEFVSEDLTDEERAALIKGLERLNLFFSDSIALTESMHKNKSK